MFVIAMTLIFSGVWTALSDFIKGSSKDVSIERKMLLGLGHDRLYDLMTEHLAQGSISAEELENLEYLYIPYKKLGGNGTVETMFTHVLQLPRTVKRREQ